MDASHQQDLVILQMKNAQQITLEDHNVIETGRENLTLVQPYEVNRTARLGTTLACVSFTVQRARTHTHTHTHLIEISIFSVLYNQIFLRDCISFHLK